MLDDLLQIRTPRLNFYVLRDAAGLYLIDSGFIGGLYFLRRALQLRGWEAEPIRGIIVTHGHLDHILNVVPLAKATNAWIAAPRLDADHYAGRPRYRKQARIVGLLESIGRPLLYFRPFTPDRYLDDGDNIDVWHGLRAVHLPGHTDGHMGYYCERLRLLFTGDLFACYSGKARFSYHCLNSAPELLPQSANTALAFDLVGIIPNHCDRASPAEYLQQVCQFQQRSQWYTAPAAAT